MSEYRHFVLLTNEEAHSLLCALVDAKNKYRKQKIPTRELDKVIVKITKPAKVKAGRKNAR